jgi:hypothetical protein
MRFFVFLRSAHPGQPGREKPMKRSNQTTGQGDGSIKALDTLSLWREIVIN